MLYLVPAKNDGEYDLYAKETVGGVAKFVKNSSLSISGDLGGFLLKADAEKKYISTASVADDTITLSRPDGSTVVITVNNVAHATKADQDGNGAVITATYATKAALTAHVNTAEAKYISTASVAGDTITLSRPDGSTVVITVNNVAHATKADQDGNGAVIADTYETKADAQAHASLAEATYEKAADITLATTEDINALFA